MHGVQQAMRVLGWWLQQRDRRTCNRMRKAIEIQQIACHLVPHHTQAAEPRDPPNYLEAAGRLFHLANPNAPDAKWHAPGNRLKALPEWQEVFLEEAAATDDDQIP